MFKHRIEIVHILAMAMAIVIGCFTRTFFYIESQLPKCLSTAEDLQLRYYFIQKSIH